MTDRTKWNFYLPDPDRSCGWTNHGFVLQFVCHGFGATPAEAWAEARADEGRVPADFELPENLTAIREQDEHAEVDAR